MKAYIFIGPPGSGKGTLSKRCVKEFGWKQLSTGNLCRMHVAEKTTIGQQIDVALRAGELMSDDLVLLMVHQWLSGAVDQGTPFIFDGFPRTIKQAEKLCDLVKKSYPLLKISIIRFIISDEAVIDRICSRIICNNTSCQLVYSNKVCSGLTAKNAMQCDMCGSCLSRRADDALDVVKNRLAVYRRHEQSMLDYFLQLKQPMHEFEVERPFDEFFSTFLTSIATDVHDTD